MLYDIYRVEKALPPKIVGGHYCYLDPSLTPYVSGIQLFSTEHDRFRMRQHLGTQNAISFQLQTFGIPTESGPMDRQGRWSLDWHKEWIRAQRLIEEEGQSLDCARCSTKPATTGNIMIPQRFDVLLGRSKHARDHTGNLRAAHLVEMNWKKYDRAGKYEKTEISERIVSIINESGGRFLKFDEDRGSWFIIENDGEKRAKIAHFFRHLRYKIIKNSSKESETVNKREPPANNDELECEQRIVSRRVTSPPAVLHFQNIHEVCYPDRLTQVGAE